MFNSLVIFLAIGGIGFLFLVISLIVGDLLDAFDFDFDADFDGGMEIGILDSRVISVFLTAFGFVGAAALKFGLSVLMSSALGIGSGVLFGALIFGFGYLLHTQQASSSVSERDLIGRTAKVVVAIKPGTVGQISCRIGEERVEKLARTRDGEEIKEGETVFIEEAAENSFIVSSMKDYALLADEI